jgi:hypothetical protein
MQGLKKSQGFIAIVFMIIVSLGVTGFTAYRTIHFIQATLPQQSWLLAFFALGAFDLGLLGWIALHTWHASSEQQRAISVTMICVDMAGIAVTFLADTVMQAGTNNMTGKLESGWVIAAILMTGIIVIGNVIAFIAYHLQSPAHKQRVKEERLRSAVESRADEMVEQQLEVLASQLAPRIAQDKMRRLGAQYTNGLGHMPQLPNGANARQISRAATPTKQPRLRPVTAQQVQETAYDYKIEARPQPSEPPLRDEVTAEQVADYYAAPSAQVEPEEEIEAEYEEIEEGDQDGPDFLSGDGKVIEINPKRPRPPGNL